MVCRNKDKAEEARADIVKETGNKVKPPLSWPFQKSNIHYAKCHYRKCMSTSWTCQRPRKCGNLQRPLRGSTKPSMCW